MVTKPRWNVKLNGVVITQVDSPTYSLKNNNKNAMAGQWPDKHWPLCI